MALAVASTTTVSTNNANNLTINKPTGVSVGDLLVIVTSNFQDVASTSSGFTEGLAVLNDVPGDTAERQCAITFLYRIADSSDVSASTYTIANTGGTDNQGHACMFRITGWTAGNPIFSSTSTTGTFATVGGPTSLSQSGLSLTRPSAGIALMGFTLNNSDSGATFGFSSYSITSSDSNPSWTEVIDADITVNGASDSANNHLAVAYANFSTTSTITAYSANFTETTGDNTGHAQFLIILCEPVNATVSNAVFENSSSFFSPITGSTQEPGNDFHEVSPAFFAQSGQTSGQSVWTPTTKS